MLIKYCRGYELEKEKPNTSEDFFNRSEVVFEEDGQEKTFHVLYVRFFDESTNEFTPYGSDPVFAAGSREVEFKDIVALSCLLKNPGFRHRKRIYINSKADFASYFQDLDFSKLPSIFEALENKKSYDLRSPLEFIIQPQ
ncbi:hypothetical protein J7I93_02015 [Bacillus sp. ISL-47]|uniref:hypothetical protein n=1 Tax=Bacillus sp. ISL-47 TaxID=2819130 RepID=UPI001BEACE44|nr:hypothetical protein [Bacillus sp. ISL-47]MBT2686951.1 hypothetical protein [Bacillus sp. ISL-47]MBT2707749.1 hypothetical protein [Pseudomonas sp. ISL-84]